MNKSQINLLSNLGINEASGRELYTYNDTEVTAIVLDQFLKQCGGVSGFEQLQVVFETNPETNKVTARVLGRKNLEVLADG